MAGRGSGAGQLLVPGHPSHMHSDDADAGAAAPPPPSPKKTTTTTVREFNSLGGGGENRNSRVCQVGYKQQGQIPGAVHCVLAGRQNEEQALFVSASADAENVVIFFDFD